MNLNRNMQCLFIYQHNKLTFQIKRFPNKISLNQLKSNRFRCRSNYFRRQHNTYTRCDPIVCPQAVFRLVVRRMRLVESQNFKYFYPILGMGKFVTLFYFILGYQKNPEDYHPRTLEQPSWSVVDSSLAVLLSCYRLFLYICCICFTDDSRSRLVVTPYLAAALIAFLFHRLFFFSHTTSRHSFSLWVLKLTNSHNFLLLIEFISSYDFCLFRWASICTYGFERMIDWYTNYFLFCWSA